ncbi:methyltransferase domain-containing protein [Streptomyces sp. NRRL S-340]|uniref:methyltransferase domain-containing protein n=1 Tax=Streptomyces sp. NRRL S-340 TaxID=1463901 RepID=UPI00099B864D|nr:methyltransferase domain-containing protein [Streptomyces sp. NRRL S-340]
MSTTQEEGNTHHADGRRCRPLGAGERTLLSGLVPAPPGGRALDVGCGTGELAAYLSSLGYRVDAVDRSGHALAEAAAAHPAAARWLRLDIENDDCDPLHADGYDLITLRFVHPFLTRRARTLHSLGRRLRPGGALVLIAAPAAAAPAQRRDTALGEDELARLRAGWSAAERYDSEDLGVVVLRGPLARSTPRPRDTGPSPATTPPSATPTPSATTPVVTDGARHRHMRLLPRFYGQVEAGRKTIEVRVGTPAKRAVTEGDTIVFHDRGSDRELDVVVRRITEHSGFEELLAAHDPRRIDPDAAPAGLLGTLRRLYPPAEERLGVLAFEFDHRPGRPGRPLPMTPAEYVTTVPHHTVYAGLYVRDEHERPVQLRSVYGDRLWQFPGGTTDAGEDPLETAHREAAEETGLVLGQGRPRLLLTHYMHPGPHWPLGKIGFIFDGGCLTAEQLRRIRLDPSEHDLWAVHDLGAWRRLMGEGPFARLDAVERARTGHGPHYLVTDPV